MQFVLLDHLPSVAARIRALGEPDLTPFADTLLRLKPEAFAALPGGAQSSEARRAALSIAKLIQNQLHTIPETIEVFSQEIVREPFPSVRLSEIVALVYLVNPRDYLPDDLPGGYGFVDDAAVLWACAGARALFYGGPAEIVQMAAHRIRQLAMCVPSSIAPALEQTMLEMLQIDYLMNNMPAEFINSRARALIENPFVPIELPRRGPHSGANASPVPGSDHFRLPMGGVGYRGDGMIAYQFDGGDFIALG